MYVIIVLKMPSAPKSSYYAAADVWNEEISAPAVRRLPATGATAPPRASAKPQPSAPFQGLAVPNESAYYGCAARSFARRLTRRDSPSFMRRPNAAPRDSPCCLRRKSSKYVLTVRSTKQSHA